MKRFYLLTIALLLSCLTLFSDNKPAVIKGNINCYDGKGVFLLVREVPNEMNAFDTLKVAANGDFTVTVNVNPNARYLLWPEFIGNTTYDDTYTMVLTPGETSCINIKGLTRGEDGKLATEVEFSGVNAAESKYLVEENKIRSRENYKSKYAATLSFKEYLQYISNRFHALDKALDECKDKEFIKNHKESNRLLLKDYPIQYAWNLRNAGKRMDGDSDFVAFLDSYDLNDINNLAITLMIMHIKAECMPDNNHSVQYNMLKIADSLINNKETKDSVTNVFVNTVVVLGGCDDLAQLFELYKTVSPGSPLIQELESKVKDLTKYSPGSPAIDFPMEDVNGNKVNLFDIIGKGKFVYIDFWATWCGACCYEIPFVEKLVEKYKNNSDIVFISISLDSDKKAWLAKLDQDKPSWSQYIIPDAFESEFVKEYAISGVPRFMVFDPSGIIITLKALKPSDAKLIEFFGSLLGEKK